MLMGLTATTPAPAQPPVSAQITATQKSVAPIGFEVVSVRQSGTETPGGYGFIADGVDVKGMPFFLLLTMAYHFGDLSRVSGLEGWCFSEHYDVSAKVADADVSAWGRLNRSAKEAALQALLADRFGLRVHRATKDGKIYELVVAKGGPKFKQSPPVEVDPNAPPRQASGHVIGDRSTMATVASMLTSFVSRPVIDKTDLVGAYDFSFRPASDPKAASDPGSSDSLVVEALQDQLGLDLRPASGPVESLVIDHVERPTQN